MKTTFDVPLLRMKNLRTIARNYAWTRWRWYLAGILALIATNIIMLEIPQLAKRVVNAISLSQPLQGFTGITMAIIALGCLLVLIRTMSRVFIFWPGRTLETEVKDDLFSHILRVPTHLIETFGLGDLTSRLSNDVTQLRVFFAFGVLQVLNVICMTSFTIAKMASLNAVLTLLTVTPLVVMLFLTRFAMPMLYKATRDATEATGRLTNRVTEAFHHVSIIQTSSAIETFVGRSSEESQAIFDANMRTVKIRNLIFPLMFVMAGVSEFAILTWGGSEVIAGRLTVGDLMAFNIYVGMLTFPFTSIGLILAVYQRAKPAAERLAAVANFVTEPLSKGDLASRPTPTIFEIKNLTFKYETGAVVLEDFSCRVKRGQRIGIYGTIGSGKTTLFNLMTRLYEPAPQTMFLDGVDITTILPVTLRSKVSYAQQSPLLFSESIRENLLLGFNPDEVTQEDLRRAANAAQILEEIERFPQGWDTIVGESGVRLSGGQKQRLALARILLRKSELIILDDVLSAVDHTTERRLIENLLGTQATLLIASHRTSILEPCDEVWVLDKGQLVARGSYREVLSFIEGKGLA